MEDGVARFGFTRGWILRCGENALRGSLLY